MKLTPEQKAYLLEGKDTWHTQDYEGLPSIMVADGPHGLRKQHDPKDNLGMKGSVKATAFPTASLTACSFDRNLIKAMAKAIAKEAQTNGVHIVLGPGINIKRSPLCGRNFEYFSEDPYVAGELSAAYIRAMEDEGTGTSVKHFCCNNQEKNRFFIDSVVDDRALHEIYLAAFKRAVKENPATVMASYNQINGFPAVENPLIEKTLRQDWGFKGVVVSDWGAINQKVNAVKAGCDLEMPSSHGFHAKEVIENLKKDEVLLKAVDTSAQRIIDLVGSYDPIKKTTYDPLKHHQLAQDIASQSMVLLKNDDVLPLNQNQKVAMIGGFIDDMRYQAGGSSHINPSQLDQLKNVGAIYHPLMTYAKGFHLETDQVDNDLENEAVDLASHSDVILYVIGLPERHETEGFDRSHIDLPNNQIHLLHKLHQLGKPVIGIVLAGSVVNLSFEHEFKGLLMAYLGGQASSRAILDLIFGHKNPSGRLAETFIDDIKSCNVQLNDNNNAVYYDESIFVGYRYYHTFNQPVRYPFGYGLSYTDFKYDMLKVTPSKEGFDLSFELTNIGQYEGAEVIQVYIEALDSKIYRTKRELKAFDKIYLKPNETKTVEIHVPFEAFEFYDLYEKRFRTEAGRYQIIVGKNVNEAILTDEVFVKGDDISHPKTMYNDQTYHTDDFEKIYQKALPAEHKVRKRPYHLGSTLADAKHTWVGRIIANKITAMASEKTKDAQPWVQDMMKQTVLETPLRSLALFSNGEVSMTEVLGLIDIMNLKWIKGIKKLRKAKKE
ncbi:MAG: glycoside hydrolase family 3 C-terminal domain-containing protein [Acholeplasmataceae bacterium]